MGAPKDIFFSDVVFQGDDGYIVDWGGMILKSSDAGRSWQQATLVERAMYAVAAPEPGRAFAAGGEGTTVATGDGGKSWQPQRCCKNETLYDLAFFNRSRGYALGTALVEKGRTARQRGRLLATVDGGINWKEYANDKTSVLNAIVFRDRSTAFSVGYRGTLLRVETAP